MFLNIRKVVTSVLFSLLFLNITLFGSADYSNQKLVNADLSHQDLRGATFIGSKLTNVDLSNSNLEGAVFKNAKLTNVTMKNAKLKNAKFINCKLTTVTMDYSCLAYAKFINNRIIALFLNHAVLVGTKFSHNKTTTMLKSGAIYSGATPCTTKKQAPQKRASLIKSNEIAKALSKNNGKIDLTINFAFDSDKIRGNAHSQIFEIAQALKSPKLSHSKIEIQGHTDSQGSAEYNMDLSYRRAVTVMRQLVEKYHFNTNNFYVKGFGESRPVASNISEEGRALNRRVTLVNIGR